MEKDSVKVFLRVRPNKSAGQENSPAQLVDRKRSTPRMIIVDKLPYTFDHIFYQSSTQDEVFQVMVAPQIEKLLNGFNSSILAYGQSGTGKTFTMGLNEQNTAGMIIMGIDALFQKLDELDADAKVNEQKVSVSFIEIYNEKVYDLLSENSEESIYSKGAKFNGSIRLPIANSDEAFQILQDGKKNRHVRTTNLNNASSRSHAMFSVFLHTRTEELQETTAVMHFCDLAGSEGLRHTNHSGMAQQESVNINRGLLSVSKVVQALSLGKSLVPYRDSVLTVVLQDSLNVRSYITILGCVSPVRGDKNETMSTIRFAQSVKTLDNKNVPELNAYLSEKQSLQARTPLKPYMQPLSRNGTLNNTYASGQKVMGTIKKQPMPRNPFLSTAKKTPMRRTDAPLRTADITTDTASNNNTFSILNCSTSTEIDRPIATRLDMGHSPVLQSNITLPSFSPFMRQIEKTIDDKLTFFMKNFESNATMQSMHMPMEFKKNLMAAVASGLGANADDDSVMIDSTFEVRKDLPATSTVVKNMTSRPAQNRRMYRTNLMTTELEITSIRDETSVRRTSLRKIATADTTFEVVSSEVSRDTTVVQRASPNLRRSTRISEVQHRRFSCFVQEVGSKRKRQVKNEAIAFLTSPKNLKKPDLKKAIVKLMNTGKFNDLKLLPSIGAKTAYQIISYRSLHGKFSSFDDLKNLPALKGKKWQKFLEGNMLT